MDKYCTHCRSGKHWTTECPELRNLASSGNPRVETRQLGEIAPEHIPRRPTRRPLAFGPKPTKPVTVTPVTQTVTDVTACNNCVTLETELTRWRNKAAVLQAELDRALKAASAGQLPRLSNAEKQRRYRARKAAKARVPHPKPPEPPQN